MISIEEVNAKIKRDICYDSIEKLCDAKLMPEYKCCDSVKKEITRLNNILEKYVDDYTILKCKGSICSIISLLYDRFSHI